MSILQCIRSDLCAPLDSALYHYTICMPLGCGPLRALWQAGHFGGAIANSVYNVCKKERPGERQHRHQLVDHRAKHFRPKSQRSAVHTLAFEYLKGSLRRLVTDFLELFAIFASRSGLKFKKFLFLFFANFKTDYPELPHMPSRQSLSSKSFSLIMFEFSLNPPFGGPNGANSLSRAFLSGS